MRKSLVKPEVGMGCTECLFSDSHACTIVKVSPSKKTVWYQKDIAKVTSGSVQNGSAQYEYERDESAPIDKATLRKNGQYRASGSDFFISIGTRCEYYDPSF